MNNLKPNFNCRVAVLFCLASVAFACSEPTAEDPPANGGNDGQAGQSSSFGGNDQRNGGEPAAAGKGGQISRDAAVASTPDGGEMQMQTPDAQVLDAYVPDAQKPEALPEVKGPKWVEKGTRLEPVYWQDELRVVRVLNGFKDAKTGAFCSINSLTSMSSDLRCSGTQRNADDVVFTLQAEDAPGELDLMMAKATDGTKFVAWPLLGGTPCRILLESAEGRCLAGFSSSQARSADLKMFTMTGNELQLDVGTVGDWLLSLSLFKPRDVKRQQPCSLRDVGESKVCLPGINPPVWEWPWREAYFGDTCNPANRIWTQGKETDTAPPRVYVIDGGALEIFSPGEFVQGMGTSHSADCRLTYSVKGWRLQNKLSDEGLPTLK